MPTKSKPASLRASRLVLQENVAAYLFLLPFLIFFVGFVLYPMFMCLFTSFFDATMGRKDVFIGLANYKELVNDNAADGFELPGIESDDEIILKAIPLTH